MADIETELPDEAVLVQKAKDFDSDTWTTIYRRYYPKIYAYIYRRLEAFSRQETEDIAANVFLHAVDGIGSFSYRGIPLSAWLFRIAHNQLVDYFRQKGKLNTQPLIEETLAESEPVEDTTEAILIREELNTALKNLTEEQRQVALLKFFVGLSNVEVALIIGKSEGAVKGLQHRALASLRRILEKEDEYGERL